MGLQDLHHRILSLRQVVQADPRPFAPLPVRRRKKDWLRLQEIRRLEEALLKAIRVDGAAVRECLLDDSHEIIWCGLTA